MGFERPTRADVARALIMFSVLGLVWTLGGFGWVGRVTALYLAFDLVLRWARGRNWSRVGASFIACAATAALAALAIAARAAD